jgi:hypothetical protein
MLLNGEISFRIALSEGGHEFLTGGHEFVTGML